jgi:hypothetical protein
MPAACLGTHPNPQSAAFYNKFCIVVQFAKHTSFILHADICSILSALLSMTRDTVPVFTCGDRSETEIAVAFLLPQDVQINANGLDA